MTQTQAPSVLGREDDDRIRTVGMMAKTGFSGLNVQSCASVNAPVVAVKTLIHDVLPRDVGMMAKPSATAFPPNLRRIVAAQAPAMH